jgi:hypothetical protein
VKQRRKPGCSFVPEHNDDEISNVDRLAAQPIQVIPDASRFPRMKKFRFQLLHHWLVTRFEPCRVADVGGGKGLLSHLLLQSGWQATIIDPIKQALPVKYKDIHAKTRVKITPQTKVPTLAVEFTEEMAENFDLLIGMHAHGCNVKIIDAAARYGCGFIIFPCCVIDEPFYPRLGVHWLESLASYAASQGHALYPIRLNFKGQNIGLVATGNKLTMKGNPS